MNGVRSPACSGRANSLGPTCSGCNPIANWDATQVLASLVHTIDPFALEFGNGLGVRWYGLSYAVGFLVAWLILRTLARAGRIALSTTQVADLMTYSIAGVIIGGRLGHVLFYEPQLFATFHADFPWWGLLDIHRGGMSSHGGIIGTVVAGAIFARSIGVPTLHMIDCIAFASPAGLCLGRLANWVNGELPGRPLPTTMQASAPWWSVKYPAEVLEPTFPAAALAPFEWLVDPRLPLPDAVYNAAYLNRADVLSKLEPLLTAYYPNNFIQAFTDGPLLLTAMALIWLRPRKPGMIAATFLIVYGALRLGSEQFRQPDDGVMMVGPATLPMALSLSMVAVGAALAVWATRRPAARMGGLIPQK